MFRFLVSSSLSLVLFASFASADIPRVKPPLTKPPAIEDMPCGYLFCEAWAECPNGTSVYIIVTENLDGDKYGCIDGFDAREALRGICEPVVASAIVDNIDKAPRLPMPPTYKIECTPFAQ